MSAMFEDQVAVGAMLAVAISVVIFVYLFIKGYKLINKK